MGFLAELSANVNRLSLRLSKSFLGETPVHFAKKESIVFSYAYLHDDVPVKNARGKLDFLGLGCVARHSQLFLLPGSSLSVVPRETLECVHSCW